MLPYLNAAFSLAHTCRTGALQVTTEGGAYTSASYEPLDAIGLAQHFLPALLKLPWFPELLTPPYNRHN